LIVIHVGPTAEVFYNNGRGRPLAGKKGKRCLTFQQLFECGNATVEALTKIAHRNPRRNWPTLVERVESRQCSCREFFGVLEK
jgi:hypothetical protein